MLATYFPLLILEVLDLITIVECLEKVFFNDEMILPVVGCLEDLPTVGNDPSFLVGDEAFPLQSWLPRPYLGQGIPKEQRIFKYRLSRARRYQELVRYTCHPLVSFCTVEKTDRIVKATIC